MPKLPKLYRDATTGQYTTAEDAAARPAETVSESAPARHETPDVAELRRLAEAATPGPWDFHRPHPAYRAYSIEQVMPEGHLGEAVAVTEEGAVEGNAAYIAAASPDVVLGLLDRLAHMREARDNARAEVERLTAQVERVRALHKSSGDAETQGYTGLGYGYISPYCMGEVASDEYGVPWPCETIRAIDGGES